MASDDLFADAGVSDAMPSSPDMPSGAMPSGPMDAPQQALAPTQPRTQKPRSNVYTMMLILSLAAIVTSCVVLYLYLAQYGDYPWWEPPTSVTTEV